MKRITSARELGKLNLGKHAYALFVLCATTAIGLPAQTFTTLISLDGTNGASPYAMSLIQATNGDFYGTTLSGGAYGGGTVFKITPSGTLTTLHSFCAQSGCTDGDEPYQGLVQATNGNFYGTTLGGGAYGNGTVFKITPSGTLTTLHGFDGTDGSLPLSILVQATNQNFYGTACSGGANNAGTVFEITPAGTLTTLHSFDGTDGSCPDAGLVKATNENFYGTTLSGGAYGYGTVFKITPSGTLTTLHSFCALSGCPDGYGHYNVLIQATNGNLYGTTAGGGAGGVSWCDDGGGEGWGTVFEITPSGTLTTLHTFDGTDGSVPDAGLVQATNGNFYGTTACGGANNAGTVFEITLGGTLTTLHSFEGPSPEGAGANGGLAQATNGSFYGTTTAGGANNDGTVFRLSVGLGPFVETQTTSGKVGAAVKILGTDLTGATSVSFNGTAATFTVVSSSLITTTVPTGADTGTVQVVTPGGKLSSNVPFRVLP
ncbi:MAG: choice-of-anchor tandem repeat GloVer-containing protein [Bryobacteraceae bacterium]|jgi:uncharacterized repeat protein (TIGR03803 family)